jgi:hypothetical protein
MKRISCEKCHARVEALRRHEGLEPNAETDALMWLVFDAARSIGKAAVRALAGRSAVELLRAYDSRVDVPAAQLLDLTRIVLRAPPGTLERVCVALSLQGFDKEITDVLAS